MRLKTLLRFALALFPLTATGTAAQTLVVPAIAAARHRELPADQQIIHALSRLTFGPKPGDIVRVRAIGLDEWIDKQLQPERIDDSALEAFVSRYPTINRDQNDLLREYAKQQRERREARRDRAQGSMTGTDSAAMRSELRRLGNSRRDVVNQLQSSRVARAVASERQLREVMTDFWHNHFNIFAQKGPPEPYYLVDFDQNVIRPQALGKFRSLLGAVAKSPAMLFYLDNARSMAEKLNENYARELLELHTLGVDGGYTQQDVINVARAFTGWTIRRPQQGGGFIFRSQVHDAGEKLVLGHKLAAGRGMEDAEDVLDILARSPVTARFIATKIARRFVSDVPPKALVDRAAQVFLQTDGDIREVVRTIVTSPEFFSQQAFRSKVKSPFEVVVSAMRALHARPDSTPRTAQVIAYLGQPIFGHQAPNGWPETGESWMNTGAILNRINFGMAAAAGLLPGTDLRAIPALDTIRRAPRQQQLDEDVATLLNGMVSPDTRAVLLSGENPLIAKTGKGAIPDVAAESAAAASEAQMDGGRRGMNQRRVIGNLPPLNGLSQILGLALGSPEFQRR
jgi:uncharacterized protein (DUF1800 family)